VAAPHESLLRTAAIVAALRRERRLAVRERLARTELPLEGAVVADTSRWLAALSARGIHSLHEDERRFPETLRQIPDSPLILYGRGDLDILSRRCVAIVGSRRASPNGMHMARSCAEALASQGIVVVSGLATGIDSAAHEGALIAGGRTVAVLGSGLDHVYPAHNRGLADSILERRGALVSEQEPQTPPHKRFFPERNRIISGLSEAVLVVEASLRSGSLITARLALEQGRDVFAVPGSVFAINSQGCHRLIREGAALIDSVESLMDELGIDGGKNGSTAPAVPPHQPLLRCVPDDEPLSAEGVAARMDRSLEETLLMLTELELLGFVTQRDGGYIRAPRVP
jgi:DNA processing protein